MMSRWLLRVRPFVILVGLSFVLPGLMVFPAGENSADASGSRAGLVVDDTGDLGDWAHGDGLCRVCTSASGSTCNAFGGCTLRAAIEESNALVGADHIAFAVPSVAPELSLPAITGPVTVDGGSAFVLLGAALVESGISSPGLDFLASGSMLKNIEITGFPGVGAMFRAGANTVENVNIHGNGLNGVDGGLEFRDGAENRVLESRIVQNGFALSGFSNGSGIILVNVQDTEIQGCEILHNAGDGILAGDIYGGRPPGIISGLMIGGLSDTPGVMPGNHIAANTRGINILTTGGSGTTVIQGNMIGPNADGTSEMPNAVTGNNQSTGIRIRQSGSEAILVGQAEVGARNVISGHRDAGVETDDHVEVINNYIGTDASGLNALGNEDGVATFGDGSRIFLNLISGNQEDGVVLGSSSGDSNEIFDNRIGVAADGVTPLGNGRAGIGLFFGPDDTIIAANVIANSGSHGIWLFGTAQNGRPAGTSVLSNVIGLLEDGSTPAPNLGAGIRIEGADDSRIGAIQMFQENLIAYNTGAGIRIVDGARNSIRGNRIFENGGLGIDLGQEGITRNDRLDGDAGPNGLQNAPEIMFIEPDAGLTFISIRMDGVPESTYHVDLFGVVEQDSLGRGEGDDYLTSVDIHTNSEGVGTVLASLEGGEGLYSATATDAAGNTSEFSRQPLIVNSSADRADASLADDVCDTGQTVDEEPECTLRAAIETANLYGGLVSIAFNIPGPAPHFIQPQSPLPEILVPAFIDGTSQPRTSDALPPIRISGVNAGDADGLRIASDDATIQGLLIRHFGGRGISISAPHVELSALQVLENGLDGIRQGSGGFDLDHGVYQRANLRSALDAVQLEISRNGGSGIDAAGDVFVTGHLLLSGNGANRTPAYCETNDLAGLVTTADLRVENITVTNNCGVGIKASGSGPLHVAGDAVVTGNSGFGIHAVAGLFLEGFDHDISENGYDGVFAPNDKLVQVIGSLRVSGNGTRRDQTVCDGSGGIIAGLGTAGRIILDDVDASGNCGTGIYSGSDNLVAVRIKGNAVVDDNSRDGIMVIGGGIEIAGESNSVSRNGRRGIFSSQGSVVLSGRTDASTNGSATFLDAPEECTSNSQGGVLAGKDITSTDLTVRANCGSGVSAFRTFTASGTTIASDNQYNGVFSGAVFFPAGEACENGAFGIVATRGPFQLGPVKLCRNGVGGLSGVEPESNASKRPPSAVDTASVVFGAFVSGNGGDGILLDLDINLDVADSNISENDGFGINNTGTALVTAPGNWWGSAEGPIAGDGSAGMVSSNGWLTEPIVLLAAVREDTVIVSPGTRDTLTAVFRNWEHSSDEVTVTLSDERGWLASGATTVLGIPDNGIATLDVVVDVPASEQMNTANLVTVSAVSAADPSIGGSDAFLVATSELIPPPTATESTDLPGSFILHGNHPNPFSTSTSVSFDLPHPADVSVTLHDLLGRMVASHAIQRMEAGFGRTIRVEAASLPSGLYLYTLSMQSDHNRTSRTGHLVVVR